MVSTSLVLVLVLALLGLVVGVARIGGHTIVYMYVVARRSMFLAKVVRLGRSRSRTRSVRRRCFGIVRLCVLRRVVVELTS